MEAKLNVSSCQGFRNGTSLVITIRKCHTTRKCFQIRTCKKQKVPQSNVNCGWHQLILISQRFMVLKNSMECTCPMVEKDLASLISFVFLPSAYPPCPNCLDIRSSPFCSLVSRPFWEVRKIRTLWIMTSGSRHKKLRRGGKLLKSLILKHQSAPPAVPKIDWCGWSSSSCEGGGNGQRGRTERDFTNQDDSGGGQRKSPWGKSRDLETL